jgi:hypothetical protein
MLCEMGCPAARCRSRHRICPIGWGRIVAGTVNTRHNVLSSALRQIDLRIQNRKALHRVDDHLGVAMKNKLNEAAVLSGLPPPFPPPLAALPYPPAYSLGKLGPTLEFLNFKLPASADTPVLGTVSTVMRSWSALQRSSVQYHNIAFVYLPGNPRMAAKSVSRDWRGGKEYHVLKYSRALTWSSCKALIRLHFLRCHSKPVARDSS